MKDLTIKDRAEAYTRFVKRLEKSDFPKDHYFWVVKDTLNIAVDNLADISKSHPHLVDERIVKKKT